MVRVHFVSTYLTTPHLNSLTVWIWVLIGLVIIVDPGAYGLKCYKCAHQESTVGPPPPRRRHVFTRILDADPTCENPARDNANKETCTSSEETCEKKSRHLRQKDKYYIVLTRGCVSPSLYDKQINGCQTVKEGYQANSNNYIERQKWKGWSSTGISCRCNTHDLCNNVTGMDIPSSMVSASEILRSAPSIFNTMSLLLNFWLLFLRVSAHFLAKI